MSELLSYARSTVHHYLQHRPAHALGGDGAELPEALTAALAALPRGTSFATPRLCVTFSLLYVLLRLLNPEKTAMEINDHLVSGYALSRAAAQPTRRGRAACAPKRFARLILCPARPLSEPGDRFLIPGNRLQ